MRCDRFFSVIARSGRRARRGNFLFYFHLRRLGASRFQREPPKMAPPRAGQLEPSKPLFACFCHSERSVGIDFFLQSAAWGGVEGPASRAMPALRQKKLLKINFRTVLRLLREPRGPKPPPAEARPFGRPPQASSRKTRRTATRPKGSCCYTAGGEPTLFPKQASESPVFADKQPLFPRKIRKSGGRCATSARCVRSEVRSKSPRRVSRAGRPRYRPDSRVAPKT